MFDLIAKNSISKKGFVVALQHAPLGNALSTMASMFELYRRTGVPTSYSHLLGTSAQRLCLQAGDPLFTFNGSFHSTDLAGLAKIVEDISASVGASGALSGISSSIRSIEDMDGIKKARGSIIIVSAPQRFTKIARIEKALRALCLRGNIVVLNGAYWTQYYPEDGPLFTGLHKKLELRRDATLRGERVIRDGAENVAIHMRLGADYTRWYGGRYHFTTEQYVSTVSALAKKMPSAIFHIFSDRDIPASTFPTDLDVRVSPGATVDNDFVNIGRCRLVVGPPSTFGTWASYLGGAKRLVLTPERIEEIRLGCQLKPLIATVQHPTFSYAPGVNGPL